MNPVKKLWEIYHAWKVAAKKKREWLKIERETLDMMSGPEWDDCPNCAHPCICKESSTEGEGDRDEK